MLRVSAHRRAAAKRGDAGSSARTGRVSWDELLAPGVHLTFDCSPHRAGDRTGPDHASVPPAAMKAHCSGTASSSTRWRTREVMSGQAHSSSEESSIRPGAVPLRVGRGGSRCDWRVSDTFRTCGLNRSWPMKGNSLTRPILGESICGTTPLVAPTRTYFASANCDLQVRMQRPSYDAERSWIDGLSEFRPAVRRESPDDRVRS